LGPLIALVHGLPSAADVSDSGKAAIESRQNNATTALRIGLPHGD
jgi:hypothetical protein